MITENGRSPFAQLLTVMDEVDDRGPGLKFIDTPPDASAEEQTEASILSIERRALNIISTLRRKRGRVAEDSLAHAQLALEHVGFIRKFCAADLTLGATAAAINAVNALWLADDGSALSRNASKAAFRRLEGDPSYAIKPQVQPLWDAAYGPRFGTALARKNKQTSKQFAGDMQDRWDFLEIRTVLEWCKQWRKASASFASSIKKHSQHAGGQRPKK